MATYICKCGRKVQKNTNAENTGNRDTEGCNGCPYLLPWGPMKWDGKRFEMDVQGHECRMSPSIDYTTTYQGSADNKNALRILSLDLNFLEEVQNWIDDYTDSQLSGRFSRKSIRATDYSDQGRYSWSICCSQNKKGMAAKAALLEQFFGQDKFRLDKTPEEEKTIVLAAIEAGKEKTRERKKNMDYIISKHVATGHLYAYFKGSLWFWDEHVQKWLLSQFAENIYAEQRRKMADFKRDDLLTLTSDFYLLDDYEVDPNCIEALLQCNPKTAQKESSTDAAGELIKAGSDARRRVQSRAITECGKTSTIHVCDQKPENVKIWLNAMMPAEYWVMNKLDNPCGEHIETCPYCGANLSDGEGDVRIVPFYRPEKTTDAAGNANQCASTASDGSTQNPIFSAVATAVDSRTAEITEVSDLDSTTTAPAANDNEPREIVAESVLAGATGLTTFDYTGLDVTTVDTLNLAEKIIRTARQKYIVDLAGAVDMAHTELVRNSDGHNQYTEDTFIAWCRFMGISKTTAYQLLQVQALISGANPEEQAVLEAASPSLLYAAAKPSAPAELVQAVKEGDITTHKQYQEALAKLKAAEEAKEKAQQDLEDAERVRQTEHKANSALLADEQRRRQAADEARIAAEKKVEQYREMKDAALETVKQQQEKTAEAERRARAAEEEVRGWEADGQKMQEIVDDQKVVIEEQTARIKELESGQVIEATAIDQTEIDRRVKEAVEAENAKWEELCQNQQKTINTLKREGSVTAQVKSITSVVENLLDGLLFTVQNEGVSAENCMAVDGLLDTLQKYYNYFYDSIAGEEGNEDGEE